MPTIDKPLSELETYPGTNPRPSDFDAYWDDALRELDQTPPEAELTPSRFLQTSLADCFELRFTGVGGARVYAKCLRPKRAGKRPAALFFHGYSVDSGDWSDRLAYAAEGFFVASLDCRGQGGLSQDSGGARGTTLRGHIVRGLEDPDPKKLLYRAHFLDTVQLARVLMSFDDVDAARVATCGASQGGALALACAALEPRIARAAAAYPFLCDYQRVWEMDLAKGAYEELSYYLRRRDPTHRNVGRMFEKLGYIDVQHLAPRIKAATLLATGLMDDICPPSTQYAAFNKIRSPKEVVVYPDFAHEGLPGWADRVFNFLAPLAQERAG